MHSIETDVKLKLLGCTSIHIGIHNPGRPNWHFVTLLSERVTINREWQNHQQGWDIRQTKHWSDDDDDDDDDGDVHFYSACLHWLNAWCA